MKSFHVLDLELISTFTYGFFFLSNVVTILCD